jgi:CheY-like chemotaxis protein
VSTTRTTPFDHSSPRTLAAPGEPESDTYPVIVATGTTRYRMLREIGRGGMSVVFGAWDDTLDRPVALKELLLSPHASREGVEREARALAAVYHPNVVTLYALDFERELPRLVMEWVDGSTLQTLLARGRLGLDRALDILRQMAAGLDAIHLAGIVHGDVKPGNVLVGAGGGVKLVDFGLAPILARAAPGEIIGTPAYMSPERVRGAAMSGDVGRRGDVYSFAVVCFEVLTGRLPFPDERPEVVMEHHVVETPPRASAVSDRGRAFDEPLARGLAKMPERRFPSCGAMMSALGRARDATDARGQHLRVLVVDDDAASRTMLCEMLARARRGATVLSASDGEGGLATALRFSPHVVFVDLQMPGMDGLALTHELRRRVPSAEVVVVTGTGSGRERQRALQLGVSSFLVKPVAIDDIAAIVKHTASRVADRRSE